MSRAEGQAGGALCLLRRSRVRDRSAAHSPMFSLISSELAFNSGAYLGKGARGERAEPAGNLRTHSIRHAVVAARQGEVSSMA